MTHREEGVVLTPKCVCCIYPGRERLSRRETDRSPLGNPKQRGVVSGTTSLRTIPTALSRPPAGRKRFCRQDKTCTTHHTLLQTILILIPPAKAVLTGSRVLSSQERSPTLKTPSHVPCCCWQALGAKRQDAPLRSRGVKHRRQALPGFDCSPGVVGRMTPRRFAPRAVGTGAHKRPGALATALPVALRL